MAKYHVFNFKGTSASKFFIAGMNYVNKVVGMNRPKDVLITYLTNNKEQVCEEGCNKGFCTFSCRHCKVQSAYERGLMLIALKPEQTIIKDLPPCQRHGVSWEEFKKSQET